MENFEYQNCTKIIFGKGIISQIGSVSASYGKKALIITGKSSAKASGLYDTVCNELNKSGVQFVLFDSISSNPRVEDADKAIYLAKKEKVDLIIAIGGGSVIDTAKAISIGYYVDHSVFDFYLQKAKPTQALPIVTVLTLAATGSEMNPFSVLQDDKLEIKRGYSHPLLYPKVSFLDPENTYSVPMNYTAYGVADLISHSLEIYFGKGTSSISDHYVAAIIKVAIAQMRILKKNPKDYEARAQVMWLATNALNNYLGTGKGGGDWGSHALEHVFSVLYDIPHGAGLSIVFPAWLKHFGSRDAGRLAFLAREVFDSKEADDAKASKEFIDSLEHFFREIDCPIRLSEVNIGANNFEKIKACFAKNKVNGNTYKIEESDYSALLDLMK